MREVHLTREAAVELVTQLGDMLAANSDIDEITIRAGDSGPNDDCELRAAFATRIVDPSQEEN